MSMTPHARKAKRRAALVKVRKLAPRHPKAPEARIKLALARIFRKYHKSIKARILSIAPHHLNFYGPKKHDRTGIESASTEASKSLQALGLYISRAKLSNELEADWRSDMSHRVAGASRRKCVSLGIQAADIDPSQDRETQDKAVRDPVMSSVLHSIWNEGRSLLAGSGYKHTTFTNAEKTAKSVDEQTKKAITVPADYNPDYESHISEMSDNMYDSAAYYISASVGRAEDVLDEWTDLDPDTSPRAGSLESLGAMLDTGLSGIIGSALLSVALQFGDAFAAMARTAGTDAGVEQYVWVTQSDNRVRPAHAALDGEKFDWDDPGLKALESDNEQDDYPGDDYGCRCVSGLVQPGEDLN